MEFSSAFTFRQPPQEPNRQSTDEAPIPLQPPGIHCPHFAGFIAVSFAKGHNTIGLQPVISNAPSTFQDVSLGGGSFDVRKVEASSFPIGLGTEILKNRKYVAVKHPRTQDDNSVSFADIALELQILRYPPVQKHENIVDLLAVMYHDNGNKEGIRVVPALVLEYAEYGNLKSYQEAGYARSLREKLDVALDAARGLQGLHEAGIVHGDVKPSNLLVFKHPSRKMVVKVSDFGFAMPTQGGQLIGSTEVYRPPEADSGQNDSRYLRQQDIYSFGLTFWTILGDGVAYHSTLPEGDKFENVWKLKKSNLIASLATFNVLHRLRNESYPLMTLAKIILTSLQLSAEKRFSNMSKIIDHLEITKSIVNGRDGNDSPDAAGLRAAFSTFESIVNRAKIPASDEERSERMMLKGLATLAFAYLGHEVGLQNTGTNIDPWQISPKAVRVALFDSLKNIFDVSTNQNERAEAAMNLASAYMDEIGVEYDLKMAAYYILQAAHLSSEYARTIYLSVFSHVLGQESPGPETLRTWILDSAQAGSPIALEKLKENWPSDWQQVNQKARQDELTRLGINTDSSEDLSSMLQCLSLNDVEVSHTRDLLLWSIVMDRPDITVTCLNHNHGLIETAMQNGETPLILASRLGLKNILETILEHPSSGNAAGISDERGITPLHWIISFPDEDHEAVSKLLVSKGADLNAPACTISRTQYGAEVNEDGLMTHTPLHWAVTMKRLSAVDALIKLGADPIFCMESQERESAHLSPLELASGLCYSPVVERLLEEPSVQKEARTPKPMIGGGELMYLPLFHVISGTPRWQRLLTLGVDFELETKKTMKALINNGAPTDAVLQLGDNVKMSAPFATAYHQCEADIMVSGLEFGFANQINTTFGRISSGGSALFLAITHGDRAMFKALVDGGADVNAVDGDGLSTLHRAAKETDDLYFVEELLARGLPVDPVRPEPFSAFYAATYSGNLTVAQYLYNHGADRDRVPTSMKKSIMSNMLSTGTRNALQRAKFLLSLPDRNGSDGFMVKIDEDTIYSLFHFTINYTGEFAEGNEIAGIMIVELLHKYNTQEQLDNTAGPHKMTALAVAAEAGNYFVVRRLLEYGANPNIPDQYGRTALDLVYKRYCFPEMLPAFKEADLDDDKMIGKILKAANENTTELMSLLKSHNAEIKSWSAPPWIETDSGLRGLSWVLEGLRKDKTSS
ncbi:hypothetical protein IL306_004212 [Fusarium sp. DS 682]|nr:hypothetical protein IL306_004212 [Fusarium sp. DS 682]